MKSDILNQSSNLAGSIKPVNKGSKFYLRNGQLGGADDFNSPNFDKLSVKSDPVVNQLTPLVGVNGSGGGSQVV